VMVTRGETIYISEVEKLCSNLALDEMLLESLAPATEHVPLSSSQYSPGSKSKSLEGSGKNPGSNSSMSSSNSLYEKTETSFSSARLSIEQLARLDPSSMRNSLALRSKDRSSLSLASITSFSDLSTVSPMLSTKPTVQTTDLDKSSAGTTVLKNPLMKPVAKEIISDPLGATSQSSDNPNLSTAPSLDPLLNKPPSQVNPWVYSLMVLMPLRLGVNNVNEEYFAVRYVCNMI
jgi:hypothetical protein